MNATQIRNLTKEQKLAILSKDFLDRDGESFVKARTEGRLNWEDSLKGGSYSEYILHPNTKEDLLSNAYRIATDIITVMDTPYKVKISITGDQSATDSKTVFVATKMFDNPGLSIGKKLDTFIGLAVHEGCHLLYTDFDAPQSQSKLVHILQNIIEDERIERECGEQKPGLVNFLKAAKHYAFDLYHKEAAVSGAFDNLDTFKRLLNAILSMVRYPKTVNQNDVEEFADILLQVREILTPYPTSFKEVMTASYEIEKIIKDYLKDNPQPKGCNGGSDSQQSDNSESSEQSSGGSGSGSEEHQDQKGQNCQASGSTEQQEGEGQSGSGSEESNDSGNENENSSKLSEQDVDSQIEKGMNELESALNKLAGAQKKTLEASDKSEIIDNDGGLAGRVIQGDIERGKTKGAYILKGTPNECKYKTALDNVKPYISAIQRVLRVSSTDYKLCLKGMRSGVLDTGKLAEAFQGVPTVYERNGEVKSDRVSVCILIDESGSMWGSGESSARDTAVLLNEALTKLNNVDLYIYGHTSNRKTTSLYVYREKGFKSKYTLGGTSSRYGNMDSVAIREAANRVRKFTNDNVLFFMISDGSPNEAPNFVRDAVRDVEKDGFSVVAISIDPHYDPSIMYSKNVTLDDMSTLAKEVGKLVKKAVLENTKKQINI